MHPLTGTWPAPWASGHLLLRHERKANKKDQSQEKKKKKRKEKKRKKKRKEKKRKEKKRKEKKRKENKRKEKKRKEKKRKEKKERGRTLEAVDLVDRVDGGSALKKLALVTGRVVDILVFGLAFVLVIFTDVEARSASRGQARR